MRLVVYCIKVTQEAFEPTLRRPSDQSRPVFVDFRRKWRQPDDFAVLCRSDGRSAGSRRVDGHRPGSGRHQPRLERQRHVMTLVNL